MPPHRPGARWRRPERLGDAGRHHDRAHRYVAGGESLGAQQQVGLEPVPRRSEPRTRAREACDNLVRDVQHVALGADLPHVGEVLRPRRVHPAGSDDGLAEEGGHPLHADLVDRLRQRRGVIPRNPDDVGVQAAVPLPVVVDPGQRRPRHVHPVVRLVPHHHDRALRLADLAPVPARELHRGVHRVRPAGGEEDPRAGDGGERRDPFREVERGPVGDVAEGVVRGQPRRLGPDGVGDLLPAVPDVGEPQPRGGVKVLAALLVPDPRARAADEDQLAVPVHRRHVGERVPQRGRHRGLSGRRRRCARQPRGRPRRTPSRCRPAPRRRTAAP